MPRTTRKFGTRKTTSREGKAEYMRQFMVDYRKREREMIRKWKAANNIGNGRKKVGKRKS